MALNLTGTILKISEPQKLSDKLLKKTFVVKTNEKYPQEIAFDLFNDKVGIVNDFNEGDLVNVGFNVRGREYKGNYYTSLAAWKIETTQAEVTNAQHNPAREQVETDLPF